MSIHPTMTDEEAHLLVAAVEELSRRHKTWGGDYTYDTRVNEFYHKSSGGHSLDEMTKGWYNAFRQKCGASKPADVPAF
ncbi:MAG: hypothetical protein ACE5FF_17655, partial [Saprospiraceae bacterium]